MSVTVVIGAQWGDEAKGKMVDVYAETAQVVARFNGGDNAGHTVINPHGTFKVRLIPNGFGSPHAQCVIGPGVVLNLTTLVNEIEGIQGSGLELRSRLWLSPRCHVVMPYHPMIEGIYEEAKGAARTGTTKRGMGPTYADKVSYNGIRLADLLVPAQFAEKLRVQLRVKNALLQAFDLPALDFKTTYDETLEKFSQVSGLVREPFGLLYETLHAGGNILLEGAQGALLDNDWGTYPFCTASTTLASEATAGLGIAPRHIQHVVGVAKAYTSRVGSGPMPTELLDETGETLRREGQEYGTVTGRPRRCGWLDGAALHFACRINGVSALALTKLDVLDKLPVIRIGVGYRVRGEPQGRLRHYWEGDACWLETVEPVYMDMPGWQQSTTQARRWEELPPQAQAFVRKVSQVVETPVTAVSVGPERGETIFLEK